MENIKKKIADLIEKLQLWEYEYYALEQPSVTDFEYDQNLKMLIELEEKYPELKRKDSPSVRVGGYVSEKFVKVKHNYPMLSLSNAFDKNDLLKFDNDIKKALDVKSVDYIVEPKIDGLSISLIYKNGYLLKAITRGDGLVGEDVTQNIKTIKTIPLKIDFDGEIEIRGEIFLDKESFNKINNDPSNLKKFANARNAASGSLRNLDSKITASRNLKGYFYYVPDNEKINCDSQWAVLKWLQKNKIVVSNEIKRCNSIDDVFIQIDYLSAKRNDFKYDIDGIVVKVNNIKYYDELGYTSKFPKWAIAYKFLATVKETKLLSITTTVGRTGKINFISHLNPVEIDGSIITKATLHNAEYILEKDIRINDIVQVYKAGDIIPKIIAPIITKREDNSFVWNKPLNCPGCNSVLVQPDNEVDQYCLNDDCQEKLIQQIIHFCSRDGMNIEGVSEMIIRKFYEHKIIQDYTDLFLLEAKKSIILSLDILIKEKSFNNLISAINKSKNNSLEKLLFALGIKHIGENAAKVISCRFKNIDNLMQANYEQLKNVGEIGDKMANSIIEWFANKFNLEKINKLRNYGINFEYIDEFQNFVIPTNNLIYMNKKFVITGSFNLDRNKIKNILESAYQSKVTNTVTKNTDFLIIGKNYTESKLQKAKILNVKIVDFPFWDL